MAKHHTGKHHEGHKPENGNESKSGSLKIHGGFKAGEGQKMHGEKKAARKK